MKKIFSILVALNIVSPLSAIPSQAYLSYLKSLYAAKIGDIDNAIEECQRVINLDNNAILVYKDLTLLYWQAGKPKEAFESAVKYEEVNGNTLTAQMFLGSFYMLAGDMEKARQAWKKALIIDPQNEAAALYLLAYNSSDSNPESAIKYWHKFIEKEPDSAEGYFQLGIAYDKSGQLANAKESLLKAISLRPDSPEAHMYLAQIYEKEEKYLAAAHEYERYLEIVPDNSTAIIYLGGLYYKQKNYAAAEKTFLKAYHLNPEDKTVSFWLGILAEERKDWDSAIKYFESIVNINEDSAVVLTRLSYYYSAKKDYNRAAKYMEKVMLIDPKNPNTHYLLGLAYLDLKKYKYAEKYFKKSLELKPDQEEIFFHLGVLYDQWGKFDKAVPALEAAIKLNPAFAQALNYLGYSLADRSMRLDDSLEYVNRALTLDPDNGSYIDSLGWIYYKQGKYSEAMNEFKKALEKSNDAVIWEHMGDTYLKLKDMANAWDSYHKSLEINSKNNHILKKIQKMEKLVLPSTIQRKVLKKAVANLLQISSLKTNFTITGQAGESNFRFAGIFQYVRPAQWRLDILGNLLAPQIIIIKNKDLKFFPDSFAGSMSDENRALFEKVDKFFNAALLNEFDSDKASSEQKGNHFIYKIEQKKIIVDKRSGTIKEFVMDNNFIIRFNKYKIEEGLKLPTEIDIYLPVSKFSAGLKFKTLILNKQIEEKIFILNSEKK